MGYKLINKKKKKLLSDWLGTEMIAKTCMIVECRTFVSGHIYDFIIIIIIIRLISFNF